ncbi:hypothetical protein [Leptospira idonii]|uniref:hypothetical protein n=1 Tax=Leptospira idonii TaxID=1193500 RepID=UPI0014382F31|nr:hypothetical protein [Leptospira idonii]
METNKKKTKFTPDHLRGLLKKQDNKCSLTGRQITPQNIECEYILPLKMGGAHDPSNVTIIINSVRELKRFHTVDEIYEIAKDIIKTYENKKKKSK